MVKLDSIDVLGGGPAGLYAAHLLKRDHPHAKVRVLEQNPPGATFGFGVVFSSQALEFLKADDPETYKAILPHMERWENMTLTHRGENTVLDGIGFAAIGRLELINLLTERALALGVDIQFNTTVEDSATLKADLVVGADGINSLVRQANPAAFTPKYSEFNNRFAWFGTTKTFETLTQTFIQTQKGALNAHHYRYQPDRSTFIVECDPACFENYGFADMDETASARVCEKLFSEVLEGHSLLTNKSQWRRFPKMWCENWVDKNRVLIGDSAHTAHFSVGSGTRLAMEDALALAKAFRVRTGFDDALEVYQETRKETAGKIVNAANTSAEWYETFANKMSLAPLDFAFDYVTRSGRIDLDRLRKLSPDFMRAYEAREMKS